MWCSRDFFGDKPQAPLIIWAELFYAHLVRTRGTNRSTSDGRRWAALFQHGTLEIEIYAPRGTDPQNPHKKDEVYVVAHGTGEFVCGGERTKFGACDLLFVPAGEAHRFENFSDDFVAWVTFYGPEGGER